MESKTVEAGSELPPSTFLEGLSSSERWRLLSALSPGVGAAVIEHLEHLTITPARRSEVPSQRDQPAPPPTRPSVARVPRVPREPREPLSPPPPLARLAPLVPLLRDSSPLPRRTPRRYSSEQLPFYCQPRPVAEPATPEASGGPPVQAYTPREVLVDEALTFGPPNTRLLSRPQMKLLLPAMLPEARRWLEKQDRDGGAQVEQQRQLKELARYCAHLQQRDLKRDQERQELRGQLARQQAALLCGVKYMQAQRVERASQQQKAEKAVMRRRLLERSLRAALRPSGNAAANIPPP